MAQHKDYGLIGVGNSLQLGKQGPKVVRDGGSLGVNITDVDGSTAVTVAGANATQSNHFVTKAQLDSLSSDTLSADVTFSSGTVNLGTVLNGSRPVSVIIEVTTAFDGDTVITVGDDSDNSRLMSAAYADLSEQSTFVTNPSHVYTADTQLKVYVTAGTSTTGNATVIVSYT